jgi:polysaccharide pyruvyl transferase WcaK-like protein
MYPDRDLPLLDIERVQIIHDTTCLPAIDQPSRRSEDELTSSTRTMRSMRRLVKAILPFGLVTNLTEFRRPRVESDIIEPRPTTEDGFNHIRHLKQTILASDAVIAIGGDTFIDDYGPPIHNLELVEYAQFLGVKTVVWGASIWPFKTTGIEARVKQMLERCSLVTARDSMTLDYLRKLGVTGNTALVADSAFLLPAIPSSKVDLSWTRRSQQLVGFNGSPLAGCYLPPAQYQSAVDTIVAFLRGLVDEYSRDIILTPHDAFPGARERDFLYELLQIVDRPRHVYLPPVGLTACETKALIGQCEFFIAMRFHPSIASLSQSIPTLALSHSCKFAGLHQEVFGHTRYVIPYNDITIDSLLTGFSTLLAEKDSAKRHLDARIPQLQSAARYGGQLLWTLMSSAGGRATVPQPNQTEHQF